MGLGLFLFSLIFSVLLYFLQLTHIDSKKKMNLFLNESKDPFHLIPFMSYLKIFTVSYYYKLNLIFPTWCLRPLSFWFKHTCF